MSQYEIVPAKLDALFGNIVPPIDIDVHVYPQSFEAARWVPKVNATYTFRKEVLRSVLNFMLDARNGTVTDALHLIGPTGSGKSSVVTQVAARLGMPVVQVTGHGRLEIPQLLYGKSAVNGTLFTTDGPLTLAMRNGWLFMLDEVDLIEPETLTGLNDILESGRVVIEDSGELIEAAQGFGFVVTSNTAGGGDETAAYVGTKMQNIAFRDRFIKVEVGYPEREAEVTLLQQATGLSAEQAEPYVDVANMVRTAFADVATGLTATLSVRGLIRWVTLSQKYAALAQQGLHPLYYALDLTILNGLTTPEKKAIEEMVAQVFGATRTLVQQAAA
ncbi:MAG: AAA family ATPase [Rhodanobacter sp.]